MSDSEWSVITDSELAAEREKVRVLREALAHIVQVNQHKTLPYGSHPAMMQAKAALAATEAK